VAVGFGLSVAALSVGGAQVTLRSSFPHPLIEILCARGAGRVTFACSVFLIGTNRICFGDPLALQIARHPLRHSYWS